ncbi:hypothetical protein X751_08615 [Mesorhizobium sp. LNJC395A00]|nr:hypothetical protein X751_08615 [Mesorhizobium sp. LNJC395A00]
MRVLHDGRRKPLSQPFAVMALQNRSLTLAVLKADTEEGAIRAVGAAPRQGWKPSG